MHQPRVVRRSLDVALLCALAVIAATPSADAAVPKASAKLVAHNHSTPGDGWHIEMTVSADSKRLRQLVLHEEPCEATVLASNVAILEDGRIDSSKPFTSRGRRGTWSLQASFPDPEHGVGSFQLSLPGCDAPVRTFSAHEEGHHSGGGHAHHHAALYGTPFGQYPDLSRATPARRAQGRRLWRASVRESRGRFATYRRARRVGFVKLPLQPRRPRLFHLRHAGYAATPRSFDAKRPESLVYWQPRTGSPILVAFMYRLPDGHKPRFAAPLLGWHRHGPARPNATQMTHVWLTGTLRTALANCMPVAALEAALPRFRYDPAGRPSTPESIPCPEEAQS